MRARDQVNMKFANIARRTNRMHKTLMVAACIALLSGQATAAEEPASDDVTIDASRSEHGLFPLLGDKARERGYDLGDPYGIMPYYYYQTSQIRISDLKLGINNGPLFDASFIKLGIADATAHTFGLRPNLMVLPFLTVYLVYTAGNTETKVPIEEPFSFISTASSPASVLGVGATAQYGYKGFFGVVDFNGTVADVKRLGDLVGGNLLSFRVGYARNLGSNGRRLAAWLGTAGQVLSTDTKGSVQLAEVLGPPSQSTADNLQARCDELRPNDPRKEPCNNFSTKIQDWANGNAPDTSIQYSLTKHPVDIWNMLAGVQYSLNRDWHFRVEGSFIGGRTSLLVATEYRFGH
jgi:hypothetical protein